MSSLAKQLEQLALPGQPSLKQAASKKRASLLFQPETAADTSTDTLHALALNGLAELAQVEPSFWAWETALLERHKAFSRDVASREEVARVGELVERFLRRLCPHLLGQAAHKCLEWLIGVLEVHCQHTDAVMECVLPYYSTKLFAGVVQLLPLSPEQACKWRWLLPLKRRGCPLSKQTLVQHCLWDLSLLHFVCQMVGASVRAGKGCGQSGGCCQAVSLYTSTVMAVLESASPQQREAVVGLVVPYVERGFKWREQNYRASSYIIVSGLAVLATMEAPLLESLLYRVSKVRAVVFCGFKSCVACCRVCVRCC